MRLIFFVLLCRILNSQILSWPDHVYEKQRTNLYLQSQNGSHTKRDQKEDQDKNVRLESKKTCKAQKCKKGGYIIYRDKWRDIMETAMDYNGLE